MSDRDVHQQDKNTRIIRTLYQFGLIMIGYFCLTLMTEDISAYRTLLVMGLFFVITLIVQLPKNARLDESFSQEY